VSKERPILFSAPMVRAILAGRKTQTRRMVKPSPGRQAAWLTMEVLHSAASAVIGFVNGVLGTQLEHPKGGPLTWIKCTHGKPGDRLWVRETHYVAGRAQGNEAYELLINYRAGGEGKWVPVSKSEYYSCYDKGDGDKPSIHMKRAYSRLLLEILSVRVERLNEISEADAIAEGVERVAEAWRDYRYDDLSQSTAKASFNTLWQSINGFDNWAANPWVWCIEFKIVEGGQAA
jgi:hypothetical protein